MALAAAMFPTESDNEADGGPSSGPQIRWFGVHNCVQDRGPGEHDVYVGGNLIGSFRDDDIAQRDALMVLASTDKRVLDAAVGEAFGVSKATVQAVRAKFRRGGLRAIVNRRRRGAPEKVTPRRRAKVFELFEQGVSVRAASRAVKGLGYGSVQRLYVEWKAQQTPPLAGPVENTDARSDAGGEPVDLFTGTWEQDSGVSVAANENAGVDESCGEADLGSECEPNAVEEEGLEAERSECTLEEVVPDSDKQIQHAGAWIALAMLSALTVHGIAQRLRGTIGSVTLRVALDAVAAALVLREGCVEGVRRLATPTAAALLRARGAVTASWVRRVLHRFAEQAGATWHLALATVLAERASDARDDGRIVLYIDNHLRPYTGKFTVRKGWKMQDKRAVPGTSDYSVHDEFGRPLFRVDVPSHGSLTAWLRPIGRFVRDALEGTVKPLLVFDRGGAFPKEMAALRDEDFEFLTYERAPYPTLPVAMFDRNLELVLPSRPHCPIRIAFTDAPAKNLRQQRGRVRRIALRMPDGHQINILTSSTLPAEELIPIQLQRWGRQENQFKHGIERWGINQLDGRKVQPYPDGTIIPNPARRKLDRSLQLLRAGEGQLRRKLAR
jgi:transposase